jgi:3-oxoacyl-[acyl-carrier protein] reductase
MTKPLEGKHALVTGGGRGIGRGISTRLAADGAFVIVHYGRDRSSADETVAAIQAAGGQAATISADLGTANGPQAAASAATALAPQIDILVNNAGVQAGGPIAELEIEQFDVDVAVNMRAPLFVIKHLLDHIPPGGRIINISSGLSQIAFPAKVGYAMAKASINAMTKALAKELGPKNITVNAVGPGITQTDMQGWLATPQGRQRAASTTALGRVGQIEEIADAVAFVASHDARWITGTYIDVSGGSLIGG